MELYYKDLISEEASLVKPLENAFEEIESVSEEEIQIVFRGKVEQTASEEAGASLDIEALASKLSLEEEETSIEIQEEEKEELVTT